MIYTSAERIIGPTITKPQPLTLIAVGDIMLGRNVENYMKEKGSNYPFEHVAEFLKSADFVIANLEGPILENHIQTPSLAFKFAFDDSVVEQLIQNNVKVVSLANNHLYDYGSNGYVETVRHLSDAEIQGVGHPYSVSPEYVVRKTNNNRPIVYVGFNITNPNFDYEAALKTVQGIIRQKGDYLIAMVHGGTEYELTSNKTQQNFYRKLIDAGVDSVIAHHPHVTQEVELYNNKPIFYSLGNFIFDQYFSKDVQEGLALKILFNDTTVTYELWPIKSIRSQPELMAEEERKAWLENFAKRSTEKVRDSVKNGSITVNL